MQSKANTVEEYLAELPEERRRAIEELRRMILNNLPEGYEEVMNWGMITYQVPLERYPDTYNGKPLMYAALASQMRHMALYLSAIYMDPAAHERFEEEYRASGKRYDAGKSCVRFRRIEDLPLDLIGRSIAAYPVDEFLKRVEEGRTSRS
ncbi:MAG: iron chaperone [Spirochaetota bacterium]